MFPCKQAEFSSTAELINELNNILTFYGFKSADEILSLKNTNKDKFITPDTVQPSERKFINLVKKISAKVPRQKTYDSLELYDFSMTSKPSPEYNMHILGVRESFAEALLVALLDLAVNKILGKKIHVELNSMGDKDSSVKYFDEIKRLLKRKKKKLSPKLLEDIQNDKIEKVLTHLSKTNSELLEDLPSIMDFLSDEAQKHLCSFLDYMERFEINYTLNPYMFGNGQIWKHIIFKVYLPQDDNQIYLAEGGRLDHLAELNGCNCEIVTLNFNIEKYGRKKLVPEIEHSKKNNKFFFIQTGPLAKAQGVHILKDMQDSGIDVDHTIATMSLLEQYELANKKGATHAIILGHKEALENVVMVRNISTQIQEMVPQKDLIKYLKKLK